MLHKNQISHSKNYIIRTLITLVSHKIMSFEDEKVEAVRLVFKDTEYLEFPLSQEILEEAQIPDQKNQENAILNQEKNLQPGLLRTRQWK